METGKLKPGWKIVRFGDVVKNVKVSIDRNNNSFERYVAGEHMNTEDIHIREWGTFGSDYVGPAFHRLFSKGQVLYGSRRTYLKKVAYADFNGVTANTTFVLETKDPNVLLQELLPFIMLTDNFTEHSITESKGSTNPYINWPDIAKFKFPLPPLGEQRRMAEILWAADETKERWLNVRKLALSVFSLVRKEIFNQIPNTTFGDILEFSSGKSKIKNKHSNYSSIFCFPVYGGNGIIGYSNDKLVSGPVIIIGRVGEYCGSVYKSINDCWITDNAIYVKFHNKNAIIDYIYFALSHANLNSKKIVAGQPLITQEIISKLSFHLPQKEIQELYVRKLMKIEREIHSINNHIKCIIILLKKYLNDMLI